MDKIRYQVLAGTHTGYRLLLWLLIILIGIGLIAAHHMETQGHWVTGMDTVSYTHLTLPTICSV